MSAYPIGPAIFVAPTVSLLVTPGVGFLGALVWLICLQGLDLPLNLLYYFWYFLHDGVLGCHVVGLRGHLICQVSVCVSLVSQCWPLLWHFMIKVGKGFLGAHQVFGFVAALAWSLLTLSEIGLCLNEVGLKSCPIFVILVPPGPVVFSLLSRLGHQSIWDAD